MNYGKVWFNGKIINHEKALIPFTSHALHYGTGVFEGIRSYETYNGKVAVFRLEDHLDRFFNSAKILNIKIPFSKKVLEQAIKRVLIVNKLKNSYIRPIAFYGSQHFLLYLKNLLVEVGIFAVPFEGSYLKGSGVKVLISKYKRLPPFSAELQAKLCGYYVNSVIATIEAHNKKFDEALLLDYRGFVAEGVGENIFIVKNKKVFTPKEKYVLPGITRKTCIELLKDLGYKVQEKDISQKELLQADEVFFTGTACEIMPVLKINNKKINKGKVGQITEKILSFYKDVVTAKVKKYYKWLSFV